MGNGLTESGLAGSAAGVEQATFGGGCFWCLEAVFKNLDGVSSVVPGYAGGQAENATYEAVCTGTTGHAEVVQITFDPKVVGYQKLLECFWKAHDPTTLNRQGADAGTQYRSVIFFHNDAQRAAAEASRAEAAEQFRDRIVTGIAPLEAFYPAEEYHHDYYARNPHASYCAYVIRPKLQKLGME